MLFGLKKDIQAINEGGSNSIEAGVYNVYLSEVKVGFGSNKNGLQLGFNIVGSKATKPTIITKAWWFTENTTKEDNANNLYLNPNVVAPYFLTKVNGASTEDAVNQYNDAVDSLDSLKDFWEEQLGTELYAIVTKVEVECTDGNIYNKSYVEIGSISDVISSDEAICQAAFDKLSETQKNKKLANPSPSVQTTVPDEDDDSDIDI